MKSYGKFEAVREMYQTPLGAIWAARPAGDQGPPTACIKLIQPDSVVFEGGGAAAAEEMLVAAAIQQSIANKAENWAPIYGLGYDGKAAFYVTRLCDRSLQRMISAKAKLTSPELLTITSAIVEGLINLREAFERSHGNLKPSNVLIAGKGRIRSEDVLLSDPRAADSETPSITRSPDVKAIGEILFALVTGRSHTTARWPVAESVEWKRLGSSGRQWWALCNDLLNTMARGGPPTLSQIQFRLNSIRHSRRSIPRSWVAAAAVLALLGGGAYYHEKVEQTYGSARTWATNLTSHPHPRPTTKPAAATEPIVARPPVPAPAVQSPISRPVPPAMAVIKPLPMPPPTPTLTQIPPTPLPPQPKTIAVDPSPPAFLPPAAAAAFKRALLTPPLSDPSQRARFLRSVDQLQSAYPPAVIAGDRPWQKELQKQVVARQDKDLAAAVDQLAQGTQSDPSIYSGYVTRAQAFDANAADAEDAINTGASWESAAKIQKASDDQQAVLPDPVDQANASPMVLGQWRNLNDAVTTGNLQTVLNAAHGQAPVPIRVAGWQALDQPTLAAKWPTSRADFVAGQKHGDALIAAAVDSNINTKSAIRDVQVRRLKSFYSTLISEPLVTDAIAHLPEIENGDTQQRPDWFEFDRVLYSLKSRGSPLTADDLQSLKSFATVPAAIELQNALQKADEAATTDQPLAHAGPGVLGWVARPSADGCIYSYDNCPPIEFIRIDPGKGDRLPFYMATSDVPVGLVMSLLADPAQSAPTATAVLKSLNHDSDDPPVGARVWKFAAAAGIELDADDYVNYFRQDPTADLPMQQLSPEAALYLARDLGCRLPSTAEWQAAYAYAIDPNHADDRMRAFASVGWKLRDADFTALVTRAAVSGSHFPDEGIFPGSPSAGTRAAIWSPEAVRKMGGWTVADLKTDPQGRREIARLNESSSDFRSDLLDSAQLGFRPVGTTHHVFHDLIGNVAEFVMDNPAVEIESSPVARKAGCDVNRLFAAHDQLAQVGVIGGSFLSPPQIDPRVRQSLPPGGDHAYADVGFRLAFTDPKAAASPALAIKFARYAYAPARKTPY